MHAGMVKVKVLVTEGDGADKRFDVSDAAELESRAAKVFGSGWLETPDGEVVGSTFQLVEGATFTWHPPIHGECGAICYCRVEHLHQTA